MNLQKTDAGIYFIHCTLLTGKLIEAEEARWLDKENIDSVKWLPADTLILEK